MTRGPKKTTAQVMRKLLRDESGAIATEYVIMLSMLVVATIWMNKTSDTLIFGVSPYQRTGRPTATENLDPRYLTPTQQAQVRDSLGNAYNPTYDGTILKDELTNIAGTTPVANSEFPERAYMGQVFISICRP